MSNPLETVIQATAASSAGASWPPSRRASPGGGTLRALTGQQGVLAAPPQRDLNGAPPWES